MTSFYVFKTVQLGFPLNMVEAFKSEDSTDPSSPYSVVVYHRSAYVTNPLCMRFTLQTKRDEAFEELARVVQEDAKKRGAIVDFFEGQR